MRKQNRSTTASVSFGDRLLKTPEAAEMLSLSVPMIHRLVTSGDLPKIKFGTAARFRLSDIQRLIKSCGQSGTKVSQ